MKLRNWGSILIVAIMLVTCAIPVLAEEMVDAVMDNKMEIDSSSSKGEIILTAIESEKLGSITIKLENTEKEYEKGGVEFGIVKIADVSNGKFILKKDYDDLSIDLNSIKNANELELSAKKLEKNLKIPIDYIITDDAGIDCEKWYK